MYIYIYRYIYSIMICDSIFEDRDCGKIIVSDHFSTQFHGSTSRPLLCAIQRCLVAFLRLSLERHGSAFRRGRGGDCDSRGGALRVLGKPWRADGPGSIEAEGHLTGAVGAESGYLVPPLMKIDTCDED